MTAATCNYCGAAIRWVLTTNDARMPLDAEPSDQGNVIVIRGRGGVLGKRHAIAARAAGRPLYLHHAATCPHARQWQDRTRPASVSAR